MADNHPTIQDAFHVIFGDSAGVSGEVAGIKRYLSLVDPLCPGPCDQDPVRHLRKRKSYFLEYLHEYEGPNARRLKSYESHWNDRLLGAKKFAVLLSRQLKHRPVVFWTTPTFPDRLPFWWMLDALQCAEIDRKGCWVVDVELPDRLPLSQIGPEEVFSAFSSVKPLSAVNEEAVLWKKFASSSPLDFDNARRSNPRLKQICEPHGIFFPQVTSRSLRLSQLDQELLDTLKGGEWLRPIDLLQRNHRLIKEFFLFGNLPILHRLRAWAKHDGSHPLEKQQEERAVSDWTAVSYRLTSAGVRIRDQGLQSLNEAPPLFVGGCQLYMASDPWVRRNRGRGWRIERLAQ